MLKNISSSVVFWFLFVPDTFFFFFFVNSLEMVQNRDIQILIYVKQAWNNRLACQSGFREVLSRDGPACPDLENILNQLKPENQVYKGVFNIIEL